MGRLSAPPLWAEMQARSVDAGMVLDTQPLMGFWRELLDERFSAPPIRNGPTGLISKIGFEGLPSGVASGHE